jgi:hypothetical protein
MNFDYPPIKLRPRVCRFCGERGADFVPELGKGFAHGKCWKEYAPVIDAVQSIPAAEYDPDLLAARRAEFLRQIAERQPVAPWTADLLGCDDVDVPTPPVSEQGDERNSRPLPY